MWAPKTHMCCEEMHSSYYLCISSYLLELLDPFCNRTVHYLWNHPTLNLKPSILPPLSFYLPSHLWSKTRDQVPIWVCKQRCAPGHDKAYPLWSIWQPIDACHLLRVMWLAQLVTVWCHVPHLNTNYQPCNISSVFNFWVTSATYKLVKHFSPLFSHKTYWWRIPGTIGNATGDYRLFCLCCRDSIGLLCETSKL